jgi:CRP-like cAMP-binding protein
MPRIALLDADPQLGRSLPAPELALARRHLVAQTLELPAGSWDPTPLVAPGRASLGLLVTDGLLAREATLAGRLTAQLFGPTDIVRPWSAAGHPAQLSWTVLTPATAALVDQRLITLCARWPSVLVELARRADAQATRTALQLAIARVPRVDERLLLLFWSLAESLGRVTPDGVRIPVGLTHATIAALVAASRPPVSAALAQLARDGLVWRAGGSWLVAPHVEALVAKLAATA